MIGSVLVVCLGNICRSPLGERILGQALPNIAVHSAGLAAVVNASADTDSMHTANEIGVDLSSHVARQLTLDIGAAYDLILVMEPSHKTEIFKRFSSLSGRTMLFDHWIGGKGIIDPYRKPLAVQRATRDRIVAAAAPWIYHLKTRGR